MGLGFGASKGEDVLALIAKKNYAKAIEVLKKGKADPRAKMQLADVLVLANKPREAVAVLAPLADEYAREGFAAKAVAVLKKIQKIDPSRRDIEQKLASLIQEKQRVATVSLPSSATARSGAFEIGIEEIGMEPPGGAVSWPAPAAGDAIGMGGAPSPELVQYGGMEAQALPPPMAPLPPPKIPASTVTPRAHEPAIALPPPAAPPATRAAPLVDTDFFTEEDLQFVEADGAGAEPPVEAEIVEAEIAADAVSPSDPMTDSRFADELMGLVDSLFDTSAAAAAAAAAAPAVADPGAAEAGQQIVVSPLFQHFSVDEMVAVIAGLKLIILERGDVIIRQGRPGNSLYMLTSGRVRAFVKKDGKNTPVADLAEGAFFGEGSILTGKPRSATVAALTECELLELDRPTLDDIASRHPHVMDVLREFAARRSR